MRPHTFLLLSLSFTACGNSEGTDTHGDDPSGDGINGYFETFRHTRSDGCAGQGSDFRGADPGFRLEQQGDALFYYTCRSATDCNETANDTYYVEREGSIWYSFQASADVLDGQACLVNGFEVEFEITDVGRARFERRQYSAQADTNNPDQCQQLGESYTPEASHCLQLDVVIGAPEGEAAGDDEG